MRGTLLFAAVIALAGRAGAQIVSGQGGVAGSVGSTVGAGVGGGAAISDPAKPVEDVGRGAARDADRVRDTARGSTDAARPVQVKAGASIRVAQGTRCHYDDYYYDPAYRDGSYYCERTGPGAAAAVETPHR